jgi:hypothetical protein
VFGAVVLRDLALEVSMRSAVTMYIPAFPRYDLREGFREANGHWQIAELRAYWDCRRRCCSSCALGPGQRRPPYNCRVACWPIRDCGGPQALWPAFDESGARHKKIAETFVGDVARGDKFAALRAL